MKHYLLLALAIAASLLVPWPVTAHDGDHPPDMRMWKDAEGLFEIDASFVMARDGRVQLHKHDGSLVSVPLDRLSAADRAWVRQRVEAIQRLNGVGAGETGAAAVHASLAATLWEGADSAVRAFAEDATRRTGGSGLSGVGVGAGTRLTA